MYGASCKDATFSLKVMVNKEKRKVLFADVDSSFADVLLSFLTLPLGAIVRILKNHYGDEAPAVGSLTSLYNSLENLDSVHFWSEGAKSIMLHPRSSSDARRRGLKLDISDSQPLEFFVCDKNCKKGTSLWSVSMYYDNVTACKYSKSHAMKRNVADLEGFSIASRDDGVFMITTASFVVTDDLRVASTSLGLLQIASLLGITDMEKAEQVTVTFGYNEVMALLKASLISSTPLSDVVFSKTGQTKKSTTRELIRRWNVSGSSSNSKKMVLRAVVHKYTDKVLYAQAEDDFVEILFSFLVIPLGEAERLLESSSRNKSFDMLYMSAANHIGHKYFKTSDARNMLIKPKIPHGYVSENHILPLNQEGLNDAYKDMLKFLTSVKFPKGQGKYLKSPTTFMVTGDLTVTPLSLASALSFLNRTKIPISDVEEIEVQIGLNEVLGILRASLTSASALSDGLNLKKWTRI